MVTHFLDGLPDLRNTPDTQAHTGLDRRLISQLKTYGIEDLPFKQEKATLLGIIHPIVETATTTSDPKPCHVTNVVQLGFYLCLRLCQYTKCTGHRRTVQLCSVLDSVFFVGDCPLSAGAPIEKFQHATQIVLTLHNQKNAIRG